MKFHSKKYFIRIAAFIMFCLALIITLGIIMSSLINQNNITQMNQTIGLMAEKVNISFELLNGYAAEMGEILSANDNPDFEKAYEEMQCTLEKMPYISIGIIDLEGKVYGKKGEQLDMEKYGFGAEAYRKNKVYIPEPYRSSITGNNVITMFAPVFTNSVRTATVFLTFSLETIQNLAKTYVINEDMDTFMMNAYSGNYISCSGSDDVASGTWNNIRFIKTKIKCMKGYDIDSWEESMQKTEYWMPNNNNVLCYERNGVEYTQAFVPISSMDNWFIVVRMENSRLSTVMNRYFYVIFLGAGLLITATFILAISIFVSEYRQKKKLQIISRIDQLTKVINRRAFEEILADYDSKLKSGKIDNSLILMFTDLDNFKSINDNYGHEAGDQVLTGFAAALKEVFGEIAMVSRIGGDEFNILIKEPVTVSKIDGLMADLRLKLLEITLNDGEVIPLHCSAGLAEFPKNGETLKDVRERADEALYYVKQHGKNNHSWYDDIKEALQN